ncbi:MAG: hypothetical protein R3B97_16845 [Dehalococcoidia bacterium]|nr:hypothetical protein [Thermoflexaceae bacterium]
MQTTAEAMKVHRHHWLIDEPEGSSSRGVCKHCQESRYFRNWLAETDFLTSRESRELSASAHGNEGQSGYGLTRRNSEREG